MTALSVAAEKRAAGGGPHCGDACYFTRRQGRIWLCTVDGLGHGPDAEIAANAALEYMDRHANTDLIDLLKGCDLALRGTRGAVMGVAMIDESDKTLCYAGVGNIRAVIVGSSTTRLISYPGIVGAGFKRLLAETHPIEDGCLVIMYTDGLPEEIDLSHYWKNRADDLHALAGAIMNDWYRGVDDAAVMVFRHESPKP